MLCTAHVPLLTHKGQDDEDTGLEEDLEFPLSTSPIDPLTESKMIDIRDLPEMGGIGR